MTPNSAAVNNAVHTAYVDAQEWIRDHPQALSGAVARAAYDCGFHRCYNVGSRLLAIYRQKFETVWLQWRLHGRFIL